MAYTASALSFMLPDFGKPVVLTGSQLPIGVLRTDGKENLLTAIEIAAKWDSGDPQRGPLVREVVIYFGDELLRGNRAHKQDAEGFQAMTSPNFPALAEVGVCPVPPGPPAGPLGSLVEGRHRSQCHRGAPASRLDGRCAASPIVPARPTRRHSSDYGSGNAPRNADFLAALAEAQERGVFMVNVTQCTVGSVDANRYVTGAGLTRLGVEPSLTSPWRRP